MAVTPASFKVAKPQFAAVADALVQSYLDLAGVWVDETWLGSPVEDHATIAVTCHLMTLDGLGTDPASLQYAMGTSEYQSVTSGSVSFTRYESTAQSAGQSTSSWFGSTVCGRFFMTLVRQRGLGPIIGLGGSGEREPNTYAKDGWWQ